MALLLIAACGPAGGAAWTYAPLGPTSPPGATGQPSPVPTGQASPGPTGEGSPGPPGSPANGTAFDVVTNQASPLAFEPNVLEMPAGAQVTVNYLNDSNLPHNINFFEGPDSSAPSLAATAIVTGPGALESITFTTPTEPGTYFFWCDVHLNAMVGSWQVT